jgi:hypothetical protein
MSNKLFNARRLGSVSWLTSEEPNEGDRIPHAHVVRIVDPPSRQGSHSIDGSKPNARRYLKLFLATTVA